MSQCHVREPSPRKDCSVLKTIDGLAGQPFPAREVFRGMDNPLPILRRNIPAKLQQRPVYVYVLTTVKVRNGSFVQTGSAPNFQGSYISLCTCKHKDRASAPRSGCRGPDEADPWKGIWVAGLCSRTESRPRGLFYLMLVGQTFASHAECWRGLGGPSAKSAHRDPFGDIYEPLVQADSAPWSERSYKPHLAEHCHNSRARKYDIVTSHYNRHPQLLVGDPKQSFLWSEPRVTLTTAADSHWKSAHHRFYPQLEDLLSILR